MSSSTSLRFGIKLYFTLSSYPVVIYYTSSCLIFMVVTPITISLFLHSAPFLFPLYIEGLPFLQYTFLCQHIWYTFTSRSNCVTIQICSSTQHYPFPPNESDLSLFSSSVCGVQVSCMLSPLKPKHEQ